MQRREFLKAVGVSAASLAAVPELLFADTPTAKKPNVIVVITDDQGYGDLGCHGNPIIKTPNIDKLYSQSVRLTDFHVSPTCAPTRAALMTGRYNVRTGVWHTIMGRSLLHKDEVTMADVFAGSGYRTGIFGKWHLGDNYPFRPHDRGFDYVLTSGAGGIGEGLDYWENDYIDDTYLRNGKFEKFEGHGTDIFFTEAIKFIEANKSRPFFCYLTTNAPHSPYNISEKYSRPYKDKGVESSRADFYGMITNIDENMGYLMQKLKALGISENTIVIFMTDNGTSIGEELGELNAYMRGMKASVYDGGHRVPCFIRWPAGGLEGGRDINRLTAHIDLLPTLIKLCGLTEPSRIKFDGKSLVPLFTEEDQNWPDRAIIVDSQRLDYPIKWRRCAVMTERWRLINGEELYDMKKDPEQKNDISSEQATVVKRLRDAYEKWWDDVSECFDEYCEIIIGSEKQNPTCLMVHDLHGQTVWHHDMVRDGQRCDGFWAVEVLSDGLYEFALRRWPLELNRPISEPLDIHEEEPNRKNISATHARLNIADFDEIKQIPYRAEEVKFQVKLKAGKTRLQGWFIDDYGEGLTHGVYYVNVKRL